MSDLESAFLPLDEEGFREPGPAGEVAIDTKSGCRPYDRMLFGGFLEHFHRQIYGGIFEPGSPLSDEAGFREDVLAAVRELRLPVIRWPGGCFVSAYHWTDGIGPERLPSYDPAWRVEEPNTFGTDEFVAWCRKAGCEPYICGNLGTGTAEELSHWIEYCNLRSEGRWAKLRIANGHREPLNVRYWSLGNENYGDWEIGAKTAGEWGQLVRESAKMMRRVDPDIVLTAAAVPDPGWTGRLLRFAGSSLNLISIHSYYDPLWDEDSPSDYLACMMQAGEPERQIEATARIIEEAGLTGKVGIAFDEWNLRGWHHPWAADPEAIRARDRNDRNATYTMADALFTAGFLNACLRRSDIVAMANIAPAVNARGPLFAHPEGIVKRPSFHAFSLYSGGLGERVAAATVTGDRLEHDGMSVPALDAVATCDPAMKQWRLAILNRHPARSLCCRITFDGMPLEGSHPATLLSGDSPDACNDIGHPDRVAPVETTLRAEAGAVTLPAHSVILIAVAR